MSTDQIKKQVLLRASQSRVWRALTDANEFGSWFGIKLSGPFVAGESVQGELTGTTVNDEVAAAQQCCAGLVFDLVVDQIVPERFFSFRWHPYAIEEDMDYATEPMTLVAFTLEEAEGGVQLTVVESGFDRIPLERRAKAFAANEGGWAVQMTLIEAYLDRHG
jgi:uncharacterized protein YndB with AHSA1/START domain